MSLRVLCPHCNAALTLGRAPARGWVNCPQCAGRIDVAAEPAAPVAEELPPDEREERAAPGTRAPARARARSGSVGETLARIAIPLGYVLFVLVPLIFTIRFALQQMEKPKDPDARPDVADRAPDREPPRPDPDPKRPPPPRTKKKKVVDPEEVVPPVPVVPGAHDAPPPRDLSAELDAAVRAARGPVPAARLEAAVALGRFVGRTDPALRRRAMLALSELGGDAEPALDVARAATADPDEVVQLFARRALANIDAAEVKRKELVALAGQLKAKEPEDRIKALNKIGAYGKDAAPVGDAVIDALRDKEKTVRDAAAEALARFHPDAKTIALCVTGLQAREPKARIETLDQIGALGAEAKGVSEYLIEAMLDNGPGVQAAAFKAMERVNPPLHAPLVTVFHGSPNQRLVALDQLADMGADAACTVPLLLVCNDKPKLWGSEPHYDLYPTIAKIAPRDRRFAAAALAAIAARNASGDTALAARRLAGLAQLDTIRATTEEKVAALQAASGDGHTLAEVFKAWAKVAPDDKRLAAAVIGCVSAPKGTAPARVAAGVAALDLIALSPEDKVATLRTTLSNGHHDAPVLDALARLAPKDERLAATVLALIAAPETDSATRARRLVGLARLELIGATERQKADALEVALNDSATVAPVFAAFAKVAPKDRRFVGAVLDAVAAPNPERITAVRDRRLAALDHLSAIDAGTRSKVDALISGLADKSTQPAVITALAGYGADAKPALPALKELKASPTEAVRNAAIAAIVKIEAALTDK
jgi:hypothetical protein